MTSQDTFSSSQAEVNHGHHFRSANLSGSMQWPEAPTGTAFYGSLVWGQENYHVGGFPQEKERAHVALAQNNVAKWLANGTKGQNTRNLSSLIDSEPKGKPPFWGGPLKKNTNPRGFTLDVASPDLKTASSQPHPPSWLLRGRLGALAAGRTWPGLPKLGTQRRVLGVPFPFFPSILPRHLLANRSSPRNVLEDGCPLEKAGSVLF